MADKVPLERIQSRLTTVINNLADYVDTGDPGDPASPQPYVTDALAFATQSRVCVGKQIQTVTGIAPEDLPKPSPGKASKKADG